MKTKELEQEKGSQPGCCGTTQPTNDTHRNNCCDNQNENISSEVKKDCC